MSRPIELVYSTQKHGFMQGRAYSNPRLYTTPRSNIGKVFIVGSYPKIKADYEALGVEVEIVDSAGVTAPPSTPGAETAAPANRTPGADADARAKVFIPETWEDLGWTPKPDEDLSLRSLAAMVSDTPIINKAQAKAAIIAELERRKAAAPPAPEALTDGAGNDTILGGADGGDIDPLDVEVAGSGLTLREIHADLEALGVEVDPAATPEEQLAQRNEAKEKAAASQTQTAA